MVKIERDLRKLIADTGLQVVDFGRAANNHFAFVVRNQCGAQKKLFFSSTPSDKRAILNKSSDLRRFAGSV